MFLVAVDLGEVLLRGAFGFGRLVKFGGIFFLLESFLGFVYVVTILFSALFVKSPSH